MSEKLPKGVATVAQLAEFDAIIDARSPGEFAEDRLPGAISLPVLDDEQRARVGTLYKQVSAFEAKKLGAALVSKNIARHIEQHLLDKPKTWRPLVYCWRGGQVLHLEELAAHKGSVLGSLPDTPQPAQKGFESQLLAALTALDPARPVFVEAESRKIGRLQVPDALLAAIRGALGLRIEAPLTARVEFLLRDYDYAVADPAWLVERLGHLRGLQSNETLARWQTLIAAGAFPVLVEELLTQHYDPLYQRSQAHNYDSFGAATRYTTEKLDAASLDRLADEILSASA